MNRTQLLNLMLVEGATHFKEALDGDIIFHKESSFLENHIAYKWAFKDGEAYSVPYGWQPTQQNNNSGYSEIKDFKV